MKIREFKLADPKKTWIDIESPTSAELDRFATDHNLQKSNIIDCLEADHLPKFEDLEYLKFLIVRVISGENQIEHTVQEISSKVAIFYNDDIIISIHRLEHSFIEDLIPRYIETQKLKTTEEVAIKLVKGALRSFEKFQNQLNHHIDRIEDKIFLKNNSENFLEELYFLKRQSNIGKKLLLLTREVINGIRSHHKANIDLRDAMDLHVKLELFYDQLSEDVNNLLTIYLSVSSQKTNEVMKVLTVFSVFFLPLTFIVGVYGMNFEHMPELHYPNAYPIAWGVMIAIVIFVGIWFKKRKWL